MPLHHPPNLEVRGAALTFSHSPMHKLISTGLLLMGLATPLLAQQDTTRAKRDSIAKAQADSIALVRELERMARDTAGPRQNPSAPPQQGPTNPRLLPDISAVGDLVGDFTSDSLTLSQLCRFCVREVELAIQAAVDPYFRGDIFLGFNDEEKVSIEQAYMTATVLPYSLEARLGRELLPVGKINTTHRHDLHTIEYPWIVQKFLNPDGLKGTGLYLSKILSPFGFYQELILTGNDRFGERPESLFTALLPNARLRGLLYTARFRNYWDLSEAANLEVSASGYTGEVEQPFVFPSPSLLNAINVRQSLWGADVTFRWRPLQQGLYRSLLIQSEFMRQFNDRINDTLFAGPNRDFSGTYVFARWQLTRRLFISGRYDWLQDPQNFGRTFQAAGGYLEWFPSEFSKFMAAFERTMPTDFDGILPTGFEERNRFLVQATFALGPHKPHPF